MGRVNYHLKNVCKRPSVATAPVLVDLFLLCCTLINKTHTRPYKLPRVRPDAARLLEREPYQEWQWASFLHTSCLRPCCPPSGLAWDAHAVAQSGCNCPGLVQAQDSSKWKGDAMVPGKVISCILLTCCPSHKLLSPRLSHLGSQANLSCLWNFTVSCFSPFLTGFPLPVRKYWELQTKGDALGLRHT